MKEKDTANEMKLVDTMIAKTMTIIQEKTDLVKIMKEETIITNEVDPIAHHRIMRQKETMKDKNLDLGQLDIEGTMKTHEVAVDHMAVVKISAVAVVDMVTVSEQKE